MVSLSLASLMVVQNPQGIFDDVCSYDSTPSEIKTPDHLQVRDVTIKHLGPFSIIDIRRLRSFIVESSEKVHSSNYSMRGSRY